MNKSIAECKKVVELNSTLEKLVQSKEELLSIPNGCAGVARKDYNPYSNLRWVTDLPNSALIAAIDSEIKRAQKALYDLGYDSE